jgi:hypothetical protein
LLAIVEKRDTVVSFLTDPHPGAALIRKVLPGTMSAPGPGLRKSGSRVTP